MNSILAKNSSLVFVPFILFSSSLIASSVFISVRYTQADSFVVTLFSSNKSSRRVEEAVRSIAGIDALVGQSSIQLQFHIAGSLNSSKITSSILLPVSIKAVAKMVKEPPFFQFCGLHQKLFWFLHSICFHTTTQHFTWSRWNRIVRTCQTGNWVEQNHYIMATFNQLFAFWSATVETFTCFSAGSSKVEAITGLNTSFHICYFLGRSSTNTNHQITFRMVFGYGICHRFQQHSLTRFIAPQSTHAGLCQWGKQVNNSCR